MTGLKAIHLPVKELRFRSLRQIYFSSRFALEYLPALLISLNRCINVLRRIVDTFEDECSGDMLPADKGIYDAADTVGSGAPE